MLTTKTSIGIRQALIDYSNLAGNSIFDKDLDDYKAFNAFALVMCTRRALEGKFRITITDNSEFMHFWSSDKINYVKSGSKKTVKSLIPFFERFAKMNDLDLEVVPDQSSVTLSWTER